MGATSLVHPRTANLPPEEQAQGVYQYTSPEELEARRLSRQTEPALAERKIEMPPAMAAPYGQPRKLVKKAAPKATGDTAHTVQHAIFSLLDTLPDERAYAILCNLATRFEMEIE